jgi:hypothetical protein
VVLNQTVNTIYTLVADNEFGEPVRSPSRTITVAALAAPTITTFTSAPNPSGTGFILSWTLGGGAPTTLSVDQGVGSVLGQISVPVNPTVTTEYTLSASNSANASAPAIAKTTVTITPVPAPVISSFAVTGGDTTVLPGATVRFSWSVTGATSLTLDGFGAITGTPAFQDVTVPTTPGIYNYKLIASNGTTTVESAVIPITVGLAPVIAFTGNGAQAVTITAGTSVTLAWTITEATTGTITDNVATVPDIGTVAATSPVGGLSVLPAETITYTLSTSNDFGPATPVSVTVTVNPLVEAPIISFAPLGTPEDLTYAVSTAHTLNWSVQNAPLTSLTLNGGGLAINATSAPVTLPATAVTTTYTLEARNANPTSGTDAKIITTGFPPATEIGNILVGIVSGTYTIEWKQTGTSPVSYTITGPDTATIPAIPDDAPSVTIENATSGEEYILTATNQYGTSINALATDVDTAKIP